MSEIVRTFAFLANDTGYMYQFWTTHLFVSFKLEGYTQGNYATVGSAIVAIAIVGRGGWAGLSSTVAI